jgi:polysaccharide export outer membrane protein
MKAQKSFVVALAVLSALLTALPAVAQDEGVSGYFTIGSEDRLTISVWGNEELSRTVIVRPDGKISLPLLNDLNAWGLTPMELRDLVTELLAPHVPDPEVTVFVDEVHSFKVSVLGKVRLPNRFDVKSQITVLDALALAGGFTDFADRGRIFVHRLESGARRTIVFNYDDAAKGDPDQENFLLRPGDIVVVR